jgi:hypothetical protein
MIKRITLILFIGLAWGEVDDPKNGDAVKIQNSAEENDSFSKHNLSIGMFDDRTGFSFIGYTYNLKQTDMNEYFIGGGTMIMAFTGTVGWKHYYKKSRLSISSVLCGQYVAHFGFMGFLPTASFTIEYDIVEWAQVKLGGMGLMLLGGTSGEDGGDTGVLPFVGLNFRF